MFSAVPALAQNDDRVNLQVAEAGPDCLWLSYIHAPGITILDIWIRSTSETEYIALSETQIDEVAADDGLLKFENGQLLGDANPTPLTMVADSEYEVYFDLTLSNGDNPTLLVTFRTGAADSLPCGYVPPAPKSKPAPTPMPTPRPPANTCPNLLPDIIVSGYVSYASQCQVVMGAGVGRQDLLDRGVIAAVDIWSLVPHTGVEVCFRNLGAQVVFLDAAYSPRLLSTLDYTVRDGMTCAAINTTGTVVLLAS